MVGWLRQRDEPCASRGISASYVWWRFRRLLHRRLATTFPAKADEFSLERIVRPDVLEKFPTPSSLCNHLRERSAPRFFFSNRDIPQICDLVREVEPEVITRTVELANDVCGGKVDVLGLGKVSVGHPPNWHLEPLSQTNWPISHYSQLDYIDAQHHTDVRLNWEINRCHQFVTLGQAYWYTQNVRYARVFQDQFTNWITSNPYGYGVNWTVAMEVAIRIVNWIWAYYLFRSVSEISDDTLLQFVLQIHAHATYIMDHLEFGRIPGNHYLANGVGLVYTGLLFPELRDSHRWLRKGLEILWTEIPRQFYRDGGNFEASIGYHRLSLDLCFSPIALCTLNDVQVPRNVLDRMRRAFEFVLGYTYDDGTAPGFGDSDDGRLLRLALRSHRDHRALLASAGTFFGDKRLIAGSRGEYAEAIWFLGKIPETYDRHSPVPQTSQGFRQSGLYILRNEQLHLAVDAGSVGRCGRGGHAHNDSLSFELRANGRNYIVDSATYLYTASLPERNRFRGTQAHNVICIDNAEMAEWRDNRDPWGVKNQADPTVTTWYLDEDTTILMARHKGYTRLPQPVVNHRCFILDHKADICFLEDRLETTGKHHYQLRLHIAPGVVIKGTYPVFELRPSSVQYMPLYIVWLEEFRPEFSVASTEISLVYGSKVSAQVLTFSWSATGMTQLRLAFMPSSVELGRSQIDTLLDDLAFPDIARFTA